SAAATPAGKTHQPGSARARATTPSTNKDVSTTLTASPFCAVGEPPTRCLRGEPPTALAHVAAPKSQRRPHDGRKDDDDRSVGERPRPPWQRARVEPAPDDGPDERDQNRALQRDVGRCCT